MAKLSYTELKSAIASIVTASNVSNASFSETRNNIVGLLDKIGKIYTLDTEYATDKLYFMDGEFLSYGKTIEEWNQDLILPDSYSASGSNALAPNDPTYRPVFYSYTLGKRVIKTTIRNNNIERAVHNVDEFARVVAMNYKRLEDSMFAMKYEIKREILAELIGLCAGEMDYSSATAVASISTSTAVGTIIKNSTTNIGILVKKYVSGTKDWATQVADGNVIELFLVEELAHPVDTSTGEAFIEKVKADVEKALDLNEGNSLNGNSLGATEGLVLILRQGIIPNVEVQTLAGAFQKDELAIPCEVHVVKDFGSANAKYWGILMDKRGAMLHETYNATRENFNGEGDFLNVFRHFEATPTISRNTFVKVYCDPAS